MKLILILFVFLQTTFIFSFEEIDSCKLIDSIRIEKGITESNSIIHEVEIQENTIIVDDDTTSSSILQEAVRNDIRSLKTLLKPYTYAGSKRYTVDGEAPNSKSHIDFVPASITAGVVGGACTGLYLYQKNAWWSSNRSDFHIQEDGGYSLNADKLGHFYGGYIVSYLIGEGIIASGVPFRTATALGALGGMLYQTFVEIQDGYGSNWGFSPSDAIANYLGAWYYLAQHEVPVLQNFTPKVQFVPSRWVGDRPMKHETAVFDDYHSMTYHLSFEMDNILPNSFKQFWPDWLNLSIGYNVRNMEYFDDNSNSLIERNIVIGLDYNLTKLIPETNSNIVNWLVQTFNHYKFPSPAIVIGKDVKFALLFPFFVL